MNKLILLLLCFVITSCTVVYDGYVETRVRQVEPVHVHKVYVRPHVRYNYIRPHIIRHETPVIITTPKKVRKFGPRR